MTDLPENPRLFVAVELPGEVREALGQLQHELQRHGLEGVRCVRPEGIHLTLKFLGETARERLPAIGEALAKAVDGVTEHKLALGQIGTFGSRSSPRVLWIDLTGDVEMMLDLQRQVDRMLAGIGFPSEARPFSPHLTLARVRPESARALAGPLAEAVRSVTAPRTTIEMREVSLMLSKIGPGGAVYTRLRAFPLSG